VNHLERLSKPRDKGTQGVDSRTSDVVSNPRSGNSSKGSKAVDISGKAERPGLTSTIKNHQEKDQFACDATGLR
jgi:hypothetical protein